MLPYCIPLLYDALPAPNNPASHPLSGPGVAIPLPRCKCSKRGFRFVAGHKALLGAETPLSICEALRLWGWRLAGIAKPQPKNKAGARVGDRPN